MINGDYDKDVVSSGVSEEVWDFAANVLVEAGGTLIFLDYSGGSYITVESGGGVDVYHRVDIENFTLEKGAILNGWTVDKAISNTDKIVLGTVNVTSGGYVHIHEDQSAGNVTVYDGGVFDAWDGSTAGKLLVKQGGAMNIYECDFSSLVVEAGGTLNGFFHDSKVSYGNNISMGSVAVKNEAVAFLAEDQYAEQIKLEAGGSISIDEDAMFGSLSAEAGACINGFCLEKDYSLKNGKVVLGEVTVNEFGNACLESYQSAEKIIIKSGASVDIEENAIVKSIVAKDGAYVNGFRIDEALNSTGFCLDNVTVERYSYAYMNDEMSIDGTITVEEGALFCGFRYNGELGENTGTVTVEEENYDYTNTYTYNCIELEGKDIVVDGNYFVLESSGELYCGTLQNITIGSDEYDNSGYGYDNSGYSLGIYSSDVFLKNVTIKAGCYFNGFRLQEDLVGLNGVYIKDAHVEEDEEAEIVAGQSAEDISVDGELFVWTGATLKDVTVNNGAILQVHGGDLSGITMKAGSELCFALEGAESGQTVLQDFSVITGAGSAAYVLYVAKDTQYGSYKLIGENAGSFSKSLKVVIDNDEDAGKLSVNGSMLYNGKRYELVKADGALTLTISRDYSSQNGNRVNLFDDGSVTGFTLSMSASEQSDKIAVQLTHGKGVEIINTPLGLTIQAESYGTESVGSVKPAVGKAQLLQANEDGCSDIFFVKKDAVWSSAFKAVHTGVKGAWWSGTGETVNLAGKNRFYDIFEGCADANILYLTDDENGDAIFVDDIYSALPAEMKSQGARLAYLDEIRAGDGDDLIDMTSQLFSYQGDGLVLRGGNGNDVIWSSEGNNKLFGDAGDDRMTGAGGDDIFAGGSGNDVMHGGGGDDLFCFGGDWGSDTVVQLDGGSVTLWFESETVVHEGNGVYSVGENSVTVNGDDVKVTVIKGKTGDWYDYTYDDLYNLGAFSEVSTKKVFEEDVKSVIAAIL